MHYYAYTIPPTGSIGERRSLRGRRSRRGPGHESPERAGQDHVSIRAASCMMGSQAGYLTSAIKDVDRA